MPPSILEIVGFSLFKAAQLPYLADCFECLLLLLRVHVYMCVMVLHVDAHVLCGRFVIDIYLYSLDCSPTVGELYM